MPQTTTAINACAAVIEVDDAAGTPQDVSGSTNKLSLAFNKQLGEAFTFDGTYPIRLECKQNGSLDIDALYTRNGTEARALLESWQQTGGRRTVNIYPEGKINGGRWYYGEFRLGDLSFDMDAGDANPIMLTANLMPDGAVTLDNFTT